MKDAALRADVLTSYALAGARVGSWAAVFALVWRSAGPEAFAALALARSTVGLLRLTGFGLGPATVRLLAEASAEAEKPRVSTRGSNDAPAPGRGLTPAASEEGDAGNRVLSYERRQTYIPPKPIRYFESDWAKGRYPIATAAGWAAAACGGLALLYGAAFDSIHVVPAAIGGTGVMAGGLGLAVMLRVFGDPVGGLLQHDRRLWADNLALTAAEVAWPLLLVALPYGGPLLVAAGVTAVLAELLGLLLRMAFAHGLLLAPPPLPAVGTLRRLLVLGGFVTLAQAADFLYAPIDYVLLNRFVEPLAVAAYAPAVQADAALLLLAGAAANVVLPRAARLDAAGDAAGVWRLYLRGTLATAGLLLVAAIAAWLAAPAVLRIWLGEAPAATLGVLPWVLASTVLGGAGAVGRGVLLGMGRARALAASVLVAGLLNAAASVALVTALGLGLRGVVYGTLLAAAGRAVVWQPWYVWRATRQTRRAAGLDKPAG